MTNADLLHAFRGSTQLSAASSAPVSLCQLRTANLTLQHAQLLAKQQDLDLDNFARRDHSGWAKAGWTVFVIFLPLLGVLVYMIARPTENADVTHAPKQRLSSIRFRARFKRVVRPRTCGGSALEVLPTLLVSGYQQPALLRR